ATAAVEDGTPTPHVPGHAGIAAVARPGACTRPLHPVPEPDIVEPVAARGVGSAEQHDAAMHEVMTPGGPGSRRRVHPDRALQPRRAVAFPGLAEGIQRDEAPAIHVISPTALGEPRSVD